MMIPLKKSTAAIVPVGPLVDGADGFTLETNISLASGEAGLLKNQAAAIVNIGGNTWSAHLGGGMYNLTLTAANTDTVGPLTVFVYDSAHRPFRLDFIVLEANVYDSLYGAAGVDYLKVDLQSINENAASGFLTGTEHLKVDVQQINTNAAAADNLGVSLLGLQTGTVQTGSTTTVVKTSLTEATNDHYNGRTLVFASGVLQGQAATIQDYSGASKDITVTALTEAPSNGDTFVIV